MTKKTRWALKMRPKRSWKPWISRAKSLWVSQDFFKISFKLDLILNTFLFSLTRQNRMVNSRKLLAMANWDDIYLDSSLHRLRKVNIIKKRPITTNLINRYVFKSRQRELWLVCGEFRNRKKIITKTINLIIPKTLKTQNN